MLAHLIHITHFDSHLIHITHFDSHLIHITHFDSHLIHITHFDSHLIHITHFDSHLIRITHFDSHLIHITRFVCTCNKHWRHGKIHLVVLKACISISALWPLALEAIKLSFEKSHKLESTFIWYLDIWSWISSTFFLQPFCWSLFCWTFIYLFIYLFIYFNEGATLQLYEGMGCMMAPGFWLT